MFDRALYQIAKPALFAMDAERAHDITLSNLATISNSPFACKVLAKLYANKIESLPVRCMGLDFKHPIGLAAGLDKEAKAFNSFSALGFSGVEMGTVTPKPQPGNDKPRLFRLLEDKALVNRMGFNSGGLDAFLSNFARADAHTKSHTVAGINIGKNAATAIDDAHFDYVAAMQRVYSKAAYITVNISSPNTKSLRELQDANYLDGFLFHIKQTQEKCAKVHKRKVPIALKVAPDLDPSEIEAIAELVLSHRFDAVIATNTTIARPADLVSVHAQEAGGLSGAPLCDASTQVIAQFYKHLKGQVSIIGVGGIANADDAWDKLVAGADYLQIYSMFIYLGPIMIRDIVAGLSNKVREMKCKTLAEALVKARN